MIFQEHKHILYYVGWILGSAPKPNFLCPLSTMLAFQHNCSTEAEYLWKLFSPLITLFLWGSIVVPESVGVEPVSPQGGEAVPLARLVLFHILVAEAAEHPGGGGPGNHDPDISKIVAAIAEIPGLRG